MYSETMPVTVISWPLILSSRTSTIPPEASPPGEAYLSSSVTDAPDRAAVTAAATPAGPPPTTSTLDREATGAESSSVVRASRLACMALLAFQMGLADEARRNMGARGVVDASAREDLLCRRSQPSS